MTVTVGHDSAKTRKTLQSGGASVDYYSTVSYTHLTLPTILRV